ncbi:ATP-dependent RNA helicase DHX58-like isoform X2 [Littorina saxatilis]|uniref:ATP-dependent RNA helicase DHX58-like isoform X2 n=1 Tax=Littorina saxatilis TaxID=31220 RepID=UPI0038B52BE1
MAQANINISCSENREDNDDGLRAALLALRPTLAKLGLKPSRLEPYIPRVGTLETCLRTAYGHLTKVIQEVVKQYESKKELELAVLMFVDEVLSYKAPGVMSCLMRVLVLANDHSSRPNEEAWCVHDVLRLCSFYMPLQEVLEHNISDKQGMERVLDQLLQKSILEPDEMTEVLDTLNQDQDCIQPAVTHMLSYVYSRARFQFVSRLNLQSSNEEPTPPPTWLKDLLQCVECCDHQGCKKIKQNVPPGLLSGNSWIAACEELVSGRQYRTRENGDDTLSESGESDISNFTMRQGGNYSNHHQKNYFTDQKCLSPNIREQTLEETRRNRTAQFVNSTSPASVEIIQHDLQRAVYPTQHYQPRQGAAGALRQNSAALESVSVAEASSVSTENNLHVQLPAIGETVPVRIDPEIIDLSRTLCYTGLSDGPETGQKEISLKPYQEELLPEARNGKSVAIFLPTGTGKTFIVLKYVQEYLRRPGPLKPVVFLAPKVKLVEQQYKRFKYFFPDVTYLRTGRSRSNNAPFSELLTLYKVFVMTPMCLVETVRREGVQLNDFFLMVLDECHHTHGRKEFKNLMDLYMDAKFANNLSSGMPQVIGLTASPGVGKGKTMDEAVQHIKELCFSMNVEKICTVKKQKAALQLSINEPKHEIHKCKNRKNDNFRQIIEAMMKTIEDKMMSSSYVAQHEDPVVQEQLRIILTAPDLHRATLRYTQWACSLDTKLNFVAEDNKDFFTMFFSCAEMLQRYQKCLTLNEDCESHYALEYLLEQERLMDAVQPLEKTDKELLDHFREHKLELERASRDPQDFNPKLQMLEGILLTMIYKNEDDCACMVFVRTIELSLAMQRWIQGHTDLKRLKPGRVFGERRGGMTGAQMSDVLDKFNQGEHKVLICTSAAEEGLDFQDCNVVIRYDFITTMISMIQTRGRARRMDSQYCIVGDQTQGSIDKYKGNLASEQLMNKAIVEAQKQIDANENEFLHDMRNWQTSEWNKRKAAADRAKLKRRLLDSSAPAYRLLCRKCHCDACMSTDLRLYGPSNRLVIAEDFQDRWKRVERRGKANELFQHNLEKIAKVHCKGCNHDWGCLVRHLPTDEEFAALKLEGFWLLDTITNKKRVEKVKWADAPFNVEEITEEELEEVAEKRLISQGV